MSPWADYIFASVIMGDNYENYTLALGLHLMLTKQNIDTWYTRFAAGAVLVSIPTAILFISLQKYYTASVAGSVKDSGTCPIRIVMPDMKVYFSVP